MGPAQQQGSQGPWGLCRANSGQGPSLGWARPGVGIAERWWPGSKWGALRTKPGRARQGPLGASALSLHRLAHSPGDLEKSMA